MGKFMGQFVGKFVGQFVGQFMGKFMGQFMGTFMGHFVGQLKVLKIHGAMLLLNSAGLKSSQMAYRSYIYWENGDYFNKRRVQKVLFIRLLTLNQK
jgi:hypothetical protein